MMRDRPDLENFLKVIPPPLIDGDSRGPQRQVKSISGEWFLGIIKGAVNPRSAANAVRVLTSEPVNQRIYCEKVGLPAVKSLLGSSGSMKQFEKLYEATVFRCQIPDYYLLRPILLDTIRDVFGQEDRTELDIKESLTDMCHRIAHLRP